MKVTTQYILLNRNKKKDEKCSISLRIGYNRKYAFQDTGIEVFENQFDRIAAKKGQWAIVKAHPKKDPLNIQLKSLLDKAFDVENSLRLSDEPFTAKSLKSKLKSQGEPAVALFEKILAEDRSIVLETKKAIKSMITRLGQFDRDVTVSSIDYAFAKRFEQWLLSQPSRTGGKLSVNSTNKYIRDLSRMLHRCLKYDLISKNKLEGYDHIKEGRDNYNRRDSLTFSELKDFEDFKLSDYFSGQKKESLEYTRDMFLFSCYTGLRLSDLMLVKKEDYKAGCLTINLQKNKEVVQKTVLLPVDELFQGKALTIFKKYSHRRLSNVPIFGDRARVTHQGNIGILRTLIVPEKKISFHSGRHTFDSLLIEMGVNPFTVQRFLGHSDVKTTINVYDSHSWQKEFDEIKKLG